MNRVYLLLGGNIGDTAKTLDDAIGHINDELGTVVAQSSTYMSEPWGFECTQHFLNKVVEVSTSKSAIKSLAICKSIETMMGRLHKTSTHYESRIIDIDILFFNDEILETPDLTIPHPRLHLRRFALLPLAEIIPDYIHPTRGESIQELLNNCEDTGSVEMIKGSRINA